MVPGSLLLNAGLAEMGVLYTGGCGNYEWRERCRGNVCSGYMESKNTVAKNDQTLTWKSCNDSIIAQMIEMFPGLRLEHKNPNKCEPTCVASLMCGGSIGDCTSELTTSDLETFLAQNPHISETIYQLQQTTTPATTTVTSKPVTTITTTTTQILTERKRDYKGER